VIVKTILEQKEAIRVVLSGDRKTSHLVITWQDIDLLTSIESFLSPLEDLTDALSGESHITISIVKPLLEYLCTDLQLTTNEDTELTKQMKQRCKTKILQQYESLDVKKLLDIATFLDPHFKYCNDSEENKKEIEEAVKIKMLKIIESIDCDFNNNEVNIQDNKKMDGPTPKNQNLESFWEKVWPRQNTIGWCFHKYVTTGKG